ncbi:hypothetical protein CTAYLR_006529 [Chrysophaeum taylorii]|uniref:Uncharacterized protein n=1 Tax=Chrysophaeum taylorii TaxID=2483200 RepID=A0AAD7UHV9_9STRA|nr:hypothetical protein CTAYLR_006529 [Chrysophaeum taylorii]
MMSDNQKIGTTLLFMGVLFLCLGVLLFFDRFLLSIGNIMFLAGLLFTMGLSRSSRFFRRKFETNKLGVACFLGGVALVVVLRKPLVGMGLEGFGFVNLFGNFFPIALQAMRQMPVIGNVLSAPGIATLADRIAGVDQRAPRNWA